MKIIIGFSYFLNPKKMSIQMNARAKVRFSIQLSAKLVLTGNFISLPSQSKVPDGDVKVSPQNLTLHLRPGTLIHF